MLRPLQLAVLAILENAEQYDWSVQGFGMLRLYIRNVGRLHIWDSKLRYPGVSMIHNHSWDLKSTVVSGGLQNTKYTTNKRRGARYDGKRLITGYHTSDVINLQPTRLAVMDLELFGPGECYEQLAAQIHQTDAKDGTVTIMERIEDVKDGQADVYWLQGTKWGTAKPRPATHNEIVTTAERALKLFN